MVWAGFVNPQRKEAIMKFYTGQHQTYCGVDLHARMMHVCILNQAGDITATM